MSVWKTKKELDENDLQKCLLYFAMVEILQQQQQKMFILRNVNNIMYINTEKLFHSPVVC